MANRLVEPVRQTDTASTPASAVSVGTSSATVVAANPNRVEVTICNDHATQILYLALGPTAVVNTGIRVNAAGGSYTTTSYAGIITAVASGAATTATFTEI